MTSVLAAKPGLCIDMSQTKQQEQGPAPAGARKDLELFWRIIAGPVLVIIGWTVWVLYQITPRSVVTPLAYESQIRPIRTQPSAAPAAGTVASPQSAAAAPAAQAGAAAEAAPQASPDAAALAMDQAQAGARTGAHQTSADVHAAALDERKDQLRRAEPLERDGLKLSPEITTPLAERRRNPKKQ